MTISKVIAASTLLLGSAVFMVGSVDVSSVYTPRYQRQNQNSGQFQTGAKCKATQYTGQIQDQGQRRLGINYQINAEYVAQAQIGKNCLATQAVTQDQDQQNQNQNQGLSQSLSGKGFQTQYQYELQVQTPKLQLQKGLTAQNQYGNGAQAAFQNQFQR